MDEHNTYGFSTTLPGGVEEAIETVTGALKEEGFGVLTTIDVQQTLKEKLGEEMDEYVILGACNPRLAHRAIGMEPNVGLLLPCNVVVRRTGGETRVDVVDPEAMLGVVNNPAMHEIALDAKARLRRVVEKLESSNSTEI